MPGFALGIEEEILFAPTAKRLERIARSNAQKQQCKLRIGKNALLKIIEIDQSVDLQT